VSASNSSSIVPYPPGSTTNAWEYLTKMVFLTNVWIGVESAIGTHIDSLLEIDFC
jgi:hypothetical protein